MQECSAILVRTLWPFAIDQLTAFASLIGGVFLLSRRLISTSNRRRSLRLLIPVCFILLQIRFVHSASTHPFLQADTGLSSNGLFHQVVPEGNGILSSDNGIFWCSYELGQVGDEIRELLNFTL